MTTGVITTLAEFDRETEPDLYVMIVSVMDNGSPTQNAGRKLHFVNDQQTILFEIPNLTNLFFVPSCHS